MIHCKEVSRRYTNGREGYSATYRLYFLKEAYSNGRCLGEFDEVSILQREFHYEVCFTRNLGHIVYSANLPDKFPLEISHGEVLWRLNCFISNNTIEVDNTDLKIVSDLAKIL